MNDRFYRLSAATLSLTRRLQAGLCLIVALFFLVMALWLTLSFGLNWLVIGIDIFLGASATEFFLKACAIYAAIQPSERPDERERYRRSHSLYVPRDRGQGGRREHGRP